jgi:transposase
MRRSEFWLETCLPNSELERNPAAKIAWDNFQVVAGLADVKLDKTYQ